MKGRNVLKKLLEDFDTSTTEGKLKDILQIIVNEYSYEDIQDIIEGFGYNLSDFDIVDEARLNTPIIVYIRSEDIPYGNKSVNDLIDELNDTGAERTLNYGNGIKFEGSWSNISPSGEDDEDYDDDKVSDGTINLWARLEGSVRDVEDFIRDIAGEGDSDWYMHMIGMVSGEALEKLNHRYDDFYEAADHNFEFNHYRESTFEIYFA